ncbi:hypothetical protein E6O75_ATG03486 [Venturia nashicola]|uniref:Uncharacterized protein n=1 Tax=Venturia nashicola TaxID=86259 RepID=A0A4Z1P8K7_9PEZI|nr:hypothetical protein E6O75_ATG03486 [Venturia nashicola]
MSTDKAECKKLIEVTEGEKEVGANVKNIARSEKVELNAKSSDGTSKIINFDLSEVKKDLKRHAESGLGRPFLYKGCKWEFRKSESRLYHPRVPY